MSAKIGPDRVLQELLQFSREFSGGLDRLASLGEPGVGPTPRDEIFSEDAVRLYRYQRPDAAPAAAPLLIVYALVNRPYMTDLEDGRSMIQGLLRENLDVYLIDWGYPRSADHCLTLEDYLEGYLSRCIDVVRSTSGSDRINVLGICQGGVFSLCVSALYPERVRNLVTMVTPVDFHTADNNLSRIVRRIDIDALVDTFGNVPGALLNSTFLSLSPYRLGSQKYVHLWDVVDDERALQSFLRMERWIFDSPDQAGEAFRQFAKATFVANSLVRGEMRLGGKRIELGDIRQPVLNIFGERDHLVPPNASRALEKHVGSSDYSELAFDGGHIGIYVSSRAQSQIAPAIGEWLRARTG
jgi:polyhydroxyalkanoate synthase